MLLASLVIRQAKELALKLVKLALYTICALLLAIGAKIKILAPFTPVPFTLQTLFLTYIILLLRSRAVIPVLIYVTLGIAGVPVFAFGGGIWYVFSPTFGYIIGFVVASMLGRLLRTGIERPIKYVVIVVAIQLIVYVFGCLWLTLWLYMVSHVSITKAFTEAILIGVAPFILWDLIKGYIALGLYLSTARIISRKYFELLDL